MKIVTAPEGFTGDMPRPIVFMAGGITNCPDWQQELIAYLSVYTAATSPPPGTLLNPRRSNFPIEDKNAGRVQVAWEFYGFKIADIILFWFARGSLNPIVLYELGAHRDRTIVVGCDPEYTRTHDVQLQLKLARPGLEVTLGFSRFSYRSKAAMSTWP